LLKLVFGSQTHIMDVSMSIPDDAFSVNFIGLWVLVYLRLVCWAAGVYCTMCLLASLGQVCGQGAL